MNAGVEVAQGDILIFLHADTRFLCNIDELFRNTSVEVITWGRFDVELSRGHSLFKIIESCMNQRSRFTGVATGDQTIFVTRDLFKKVEAFPSIPLMEDIELSKILKLQCAPICFREKVITSSRRWEEQGIIRAIIKIWWFRLKYALGINPAALAREYD